MIRVCGFPDMVSTTRGDASSLFLLQSSFSNGEWDGTAVWNCSYMIYAVAWFMDNSKSKRETNIKEKKLLTKKIKQK